MRHIILALALLATACPPGPVPVPEVEDTELCGAAGDNVKKLQCKDRAGDPMWVNKNGETFKEICERVQEKGGVFMNPKCVMNATSCDEVKQCPVMTK